MSKAPIPVALTGLNPMVGRAVYENLKPEYDVIIFARLPEIERELPFILKGKPPPNPSSTVASGNWSSPPQALIFGGGYSDEKVDELVKLAKSTDGAMEIPWLRVDNKITGKDLPPIDLNEVQAQAYGNLIVKRMKALLNKLKEEGKLGDGNGGIYFL